MKPWQTLGLVALAAVAGAAWERWQAPTYAVAAVRDAATGEVTLWRMQARTGRVEMKVIGGRTISPWIPISEEGYDQQPAQVPPKLSSAR